MLELPESHVLASQLNQTVRGQRIVDVEAARSPHKFAWYTGDPSEYPKKMVGKQMGDTTGLGCMVEITLDDYRFVVGDGTNVRLYGNSERLPSKYQTRLSLENGASLICSVQMYGGMQLIHPAEYDNPYYLVAHAKPQPGSSEFSEAYFVSLRQNAADSLSVKAFLATEQRIPGLGNGVLQDILFHAALHPKRKISTLQEKDWERLYRCVLSVLRDMETGGGRDTEKNLFGEYGLYKTVLSKKTVGSPCPVCGTRIEKAAYLGGSIYFCPHCQVNR